MSTPGPSTDEPASTPATSSDAVGWAAVGMLTASAVLAALLESFLIPLYAGATVVPIAAVLAVLTNIALPWLGGRAVERTLARVLPFLGWLLVVVVLNTVGRPEGDVVYPGGGGALQWNTYGMILGGTFAGAVTIAMTSSPPVRR